MKKILPLLGFIYLLTITAFTQNLSLSTSSGALSNGDTYAIFVDSTAATMEAHVLVTNNNTVNIPVKVKKIENSIVVGSQNYFCWGSCFSPSIFVSPDSVIINAGETVNYFTGDYVTSSTIGVTTITYVFFNNEDPNDTVSVVVEYHVTGVGIKEAKTKEIKFSNPYPNPSDNFTSFDYLLPKTTKYSKIVIRNILGTVVKEVKIFNKKGNIKLSTEELTDGIYFYSIIVDDNIFITKRLIVRH